jgi:hypothetical protein
MWARVQRKVWVHRIRAVRLVACRMQCLFRLHVAHRRAIVFRMMHEYRVSMARRIQVYHVISVLI